MRVRERIYWSARARFRRSSLHRRLLRWADALVHDEHSKHFYGKHAEDACLFSYFALKHYDRTQSLKDVGRGIYVDVGAYDPLSVSNTRAFYERGWRGINIDASAETIARFEELRPEDRNIHCAITEYNGPLTFYRFGRQSVFNTVDADVARDYARQIGREPSIEVVQGRRLAAVIEENLPPGAPIDFLTVDAEGHDLAVLASNDWERFRPEMVVVEAHLHDVADVLASPIARFLQAQGYALRFWTPPSLIFRDGRR